MTMNRAGVISTGVGKFTGGGSEDGDIGGGAGGLIIPHNPFKRISDKARPDVHADPERPIPILWRILVAPLEAPTVSAGGIVLEATQTREAFEYLNFIGEVLAMGPLCYKHPKFLGGEPPVKVGDWIAFGRYAGQDQRVNGNKYRLINDDEVLNIVPNPKSVFIYV